MIVPHGSGSRTCAPRDVIAKDEIYKLSEDRAVTQWKIVTVLKYSRRPNEQSSLARLYEVSIFFLCVYWRGSREAGWKHVKSLLCATQSPNPGSSAVIQSCRRPLGCWDSDWSYQALLFPPSTSFTWAVIPDQASRALDLRKPLSQKIDTTEGIPTYWRQARMPVDCRTHADDCDLAPKQTASGKTNQRREKPLAEGKSHIPVT